MRENYKMNQCMVQRKTLNAILMCNGPADQVEVSWVFVPRCLESFLLALKPRPKFEEYTIQVFLRSKYNKLQCVDKGSDKGSSFHKKTKDTTNVPVVCHHLT